MGNHYETLGVEKNASDDDIKKAYRKLAMRFHPDRNQGEGAKKAEEKFKEAKKAYEVLSDPARRATYDATGDDSVDKTLEQKAVENLVQAFSGVLDKDVDNAIEAVRGMILGHRIHIAGQIQNARTARERLLKRRDRVHTRDGVTNLVHGIIDSKVEALSREIKVLEEQHLIDDEMKRMLDAYTEDPANEGVIIPGTTSGSRHVFLMRMMT